MKSALIIEDEEGSAVVLESLLTTHCPEIQVTGYAESVEGGVHALKQHCPDIVFLDVHLTDGSGFDILERCRDCDSAVIFTTAYDRYALKAFRFSAIDYLLKPIDTEELKDAVHKACSAADLTANSRKIDHLLSNINRKPEDQPLLLVSTQETIEFVRIDDIIRCEGQGAYSTIHLKNGKDLFTSKVLKEFDQLLSDYSFYRVHQSHLVNLKEIKQFIKSHNSIVMRDGKQIHVARRRKHGFWRAVEEFGKL